MLREQQDHLKCHLDNFSSVYSLQKQARGYPEEVVYIPDALSPLIANKSGLHNGRRPARYRYETPCWDLRQKLTLQCSDAFLIDALQNGALRTMSF